VLVSSERRVLLAGGWFVLREKYCWLVADKPSEQAASFTNHLAMFCA
jgi:phosphomevalonate kinase